jgi:hypothetical protein
MTRCRWLAAISTLALASPIPLLAQRYRIRFDTRLESVSFRGVAFDSVLRSAVTPAPTGGLQTTDGYAVSCPTAATYCTFFRPAPTVTANPVSTLASATFWGLGVSGLNVNLVARANTDLAGTDWPTSKPALQLLEAYAGYARGPLSAEAGRLHKASRLGWVGFDGASLEVRPLGRALALFGYGGYGLARNFPLPVTSLDLNPLGDSLPNRRQRVAAGGILWFLPEFRGQMLYQREDRTGAEATVSERVSGDWSLTASPEVTLVGGGDYDIAKGEWGKADLALNVLAASGKVKLVAQGRRYRPYFDLWTIWGAFSPAAYSAALGSVAVSALPGLDLKARGEVFRFDDAGAANPLAPGERGGWRGAVSASVARLANWSFDATYERGEGPGASSQTIEAAVTYRPTSTLLVTADGARLARPLEYRFDDVRLWSYGLRLDYEAARGLRVIGDARGVSEDRRREDAGALSWSQVRLNLGVSLEFASGSDTRRLHPAILRMPEGRRPQ